MCASISHYKGTNPAFYGNIVLILKYSRNMEKTHLQLKRDCVSKMLMWKQLHIRFMFQCLLDGSLKFDKKDK